MKWRGIRKIIFLGLGVALLTSFGSFSHRDLDTKESCEGSSQQEKVGLTQMEEKPTYLYKVLSMDDWAKSSETVHLSCMDADFIHLSTEDQLDKIIEKYWAGVPEYVVLKIETVKLTGKLVLEANPGGTNKYYHLYNGFIPWNAIVESKIKNA
jgi:uncharacterized protein (DUF952 family)